MNLTNRKLVASGAFLEFYQFQNPVFYGPPEKPRKKSIRAKTKKDSQASEESILSSVYRSKRKIKRYFYANAGQWPKPDGKPYLPMFLTLTFKENIDDLKLANQRFMKFVQRFNYFLFKQTLLQYICVIEFQERGAVHYHMVIFNLPKIKDRVYKTILDIWRKNNSQGSINLKPVRNSAGAIRYLTKYLTKAMNDERLWNRKKYFLSSGLKPPVTVRNNEAVEHIQKLLPAVCKKFETEMKNLPWVGDMGYCQYFLTDNQTLKDLPLADLDKILVDLAYRQTNQTKNI